jgi:hypothetical protein
MARKVIGPTGSRRRRWTYLWCLVIAIGVGMFFVAGAQAVHDLGFQLDGDVQASTTTSVGGSTQALDWSSFFDSSGNQITGALSGGFTNSAFQKDFSTNPDTCTVATLPCSFVTSDHTTFATGSKDTLNITPGWQCNFDHNVNSKIDIMNAYAAAFTNPVADPNQFLPDGTTPNPLFGKHHQILYFGMEKNANTGDNNVAFWFLQSGADCVSPGGGSTPWTGNHQDGDILVVSAFTSGGGVSNITAYRWNGGAAGSLGTTPVANGGDCKVNLGADSVCATSNSGPNAITGQITTPWLTSNKDDGVGTKLESTEFFEGGIDLSATNLGDKCFNVFVGDTRSSQSLTATLFDYARGVLGECAITVTTTPSQTTRVIGSTTPITDTADISGTVGGGGTAPTPTGTMQFFLCGPGVASCTSGGAPIPSDPAAKVTLGACNPVVAGHACATSADARSLITGLGTYCFRAVYDPGTDTNYAGKGGSFDGANECFTVTGSSSFTTAQNWLPNDSATLTGDANLNGTLTFTLYSGDNCGVTSGAAVTGQQYVVTVTDAASGSTFNTSNLTFTVTAGASYSWLVHYDDTTLADPAADKCEKSTLTITN